MTELNKTLTLVRGTGLMLNIVVGAGLLALPGLTTEIAGNQALWSWLFCAGAAIPLLLVFVIFGANNPHAGGITHFIKLGLGNTGYVIASLLFLGAVTFGLPAIALTAGHYLSSWIGGIPAAYAAGVIVFATFMLSISPETAGKISTFIASLTLVALLFIIFIGLTGVDWSYQIGNIAPVSDIKLPVVLAPFMMLFFAFTGWEVAAGLSEEFKNPKRDFPLAMMFSFGIAVALYLSMAFLAHTAIGSPTPESVFSYILGEQLGNTGKIIVVTISTFIITANLIGAIWAVSRMVYALSRDVLSSKFFKLTDDGTPWSSVMLTSFVLLLVLTTDTAGLLNIDDMLAIAGQNFFLLYLFAAVSLFKTSINLMHRLVSIVAIVLSVALLSIDPTTMIYPATLAALGLGFIYFKSI